VRRGKTVIDVVVVGVTQCSADIVVDWTDRQTDRQMASAGGGDEDEQWEPPRTPRLVLKDDGDGGQLTPDTEDNVTAQTDGVFRHFVYQLHTIDHTQQLHDAMDDTLPAVVPPELSPFGESQLS